MKLKELLEVLDSDSFIILRPADKVAVRINRKVSEISGEARELEIKSIKAEQNFYGRPFIGVVLFDEYKGEQDGD